MKTTADIYKEYGVDPKKQREGIRKAKKKDPSFALEKERVNGSLQYIYNQQQLIQMLWALDLFLHEINEEKYLCKKVFLIKKG